MINPNNNRERKNKNPNNKNQGNTTLKDVNIRSETTQKDMKK